MSEVNALNERLKRRYFYELREAEGLSDATIDHSARSIFDYERFTKLADFKCFRAEDAAAYRRHLLARGGKRSAELSSRSTVHSKLLHLQKFFTWVAMQPGFRSRFSPADAKFFKLSQRDRRIANERPLKPTPSLEQVRHVVLTMPSSTDLELRDRAVVALILLTGVRVSAAITLKLKHVRGDNSLFQDAREVKTKFSKTQTTYFFPVGQDIAQIFTSYVDHLRKNLFWGGDYPLFPSTRQALDERQWLSPVGLSKIHWKTAAPVRQIFRRAFEAGGIPYHPPHSVRRTLGRLGEKLCRTPEQMKAWSQNLGHDDVLTTFTSYGAVQLQQQAAILTRLQCETIDAERADLEQLRSVLSKPSVRALLFPSSEPGK